MTDDPLITFVRARLDEDEEWARAARSGYVLRWLAAARDILTAYVKAEADGHGGDGRVALRFAVETLAGAWSGHPGFDREWAA